MSALEEFQQQGYLAPVSVMSHKQACQWIKRLKDCPRPVEWSKSRAVHYPAYFELAQQPQIVNNVKQLLGENIILWGASLVSRPPGQNHPWHSDVETAYGDGKTVSVWIALSNVNDKSGLQLLSTSHLFGTSVQELRYLHSVERSDTSSSQILDWARSYSSNSKICQPGLKVGDAVYFDGRIWHSSVNHTRSATRLAVLLQYAMPDVPIRICESAYISPYISINGQKPPCILISGRDDSGVNKLVPNKVMDYEMKRSRRKPFMSTDIKHMDLPLKENPETGRQAYQLSGGITPSVDRMNYHMSVLSPGITPHEPHSHLEEELLIMLSGEADLLMVPENITHKQQRYRLKAGYLVFYPAFFTHTIHNTGSEPATYLMFKWRASLPSRMDSQATVYQFDHQDLSVENKHNKAWDSRAIFTFPTRHLKKLHCHVSLLQPGAGYKPHRDRYDVAIVLLKGEIETLGKKLEPFTAVYYSAGELHGMKNTGNTPAYYLVFEFHPGPAWNRWLNNGLQLRRILKSPVKQIPRNLGVFTALKANSISKIWKRLPISIFK